MERYNELTSKHTRVEEVGVINGNESEGVYLLCKTIQSRLEVTMAMNTKLFLNNKQMWISPEIVNEKDKIGQLFKINLTQGKFLEIEKTISIYTSRDRGISECSYDAQKAIESTANKRYFFVIFGYQLLVTIMAMK